MSETVQNGKLVASSDYHKVTQRHDLHLNLTATSMLMEPVKKPVVSSVLEKMKSLWRYIESDYPKSSFKQFSVLMSMMNKKIYRNRIALYIQLVHHVLCGVMFGLIFWGAANDGDRMFDHLKYCIGIVFFLSYTQVIVPVLSCK